MKRVFLLVTGAGDYDAMEFEKAFNPQGVYENMVTEGLTKKKLLFERDYEYEVDLEIFEFGEVDEKFVNFICDEFIDYDELKHKNFFSVERKN